ncbi:hypothetical protein H8356DRAFT_1408322 [Neocallimastix lanati (nom. inval.)]|nr:hypothetical protein H8356DRAFT_1408322 [Neocallimastix sp. JGI-2020a]
MKYGVNLNKILNYEIIGDKSINDSNDYLVSGGIIRIYNINEQLIKIIDPYYSGKKVFIFVNIILNGRISNVEQRYARIYNLAMETYKKYFNNDGENQDNIIDKYDIIKFLTTNVGGKPIGLFDSIYIYNTFKGYLEARSNDNLNLINPPPEVMYEIARQCYDNNPNYYRYFQDEEHNVNEKGDRMSDKHDEFYLSDVNFNILKK